MGPPLLLCGLTLRQLEPGLPPLPKQGDHRLPSPQTVEPGPVHSAPSLEQHGGPVHGHCRCLLIQVGDAVSEPAQEQVGLDLLLVLRWHYFWAGPFLRHLKGLGPKTKGFIEVWLILTPH